MKKTFQLAFVALAFTAFTTSCDNANNAAENTGDAMENTGESIEATADEAVTPEAGDTAVVIDQEADAVIKTEETPAQ